MFQCLGTKYSESWFDTEGRTTATMVVAIGECCSYSAWTQYQRLPANPIGGAVGQLISPVLDTVRTSVSTTIFTARKMALIRHLQILVLGIATTVIAPTVFLIGNKPPTPPSTFILRPSHAVRANISSAYAGSKPPGSLRALLLAMAGRAPTRESAMTVRERIDFAVIIVVFGILVAA